MKIVKQLIRLDKMRSVDDAIYIHADTAVQAWITHKIESQIWQRGTEQVLLQIIEYIEANR